MKSSKSPKEIAAIKDQFTSLLAEKSEEEAIEHDADMLMAAFLSEIEKFQKDNKVSRKQLAAQIKTSPSYLTQVFRGDKPLNFHTLAKIQRALKIRFQINTILPDPIAASIKPGKTKTRMIYNQNHAQI